MTPSGPHNRDRFKAEGDLNISPHRASWSDASARSLYQEIRSRLGEEIGVELRLVETIPREPNGKFRAVKSRVGGDPA